MATKDNQLEYKGHPLRRKDNLIYFGDMSDEYIVQLQIMDTKMVVDMDVGRHGSGSNLAGAGLDDEITLVRVLPRRFAAYKK